MYDTTAKAGVAADRGPPMSESPVSRGWARDVDALFPLAFPSPWGRDLTKEEAYIQKLDGSTGASLKLTVLNAEGRIWTMVAGGGASVVYR